MIQSSGGYRTAIDPVFLAASVTPPPQARVLDAGCGTGAAALCLATRVADCTIVGVERAPEAAALARRNVTGNALQDRVAIIEAAISDYADSVAGQFDQVMINPPFHEAGRHSASPDPGKAAAHGEDDLDLAGWVRAADKALRRGGAVTIIHRADRIAPLLGALGSGFGAIAILPLWPRAGVDAKRIIVRAIKGRRTPARLLPGLVLHEADGRFTAEADAILRDAASLDLGESGD